MDKAAFSYRRYKNDVVMWVSERFGPDAFILDVGAGGGVYYDLLCSRYHNIDAVEVYKPNILDYRLLEKYRSVSYRNIVGLEYQPYDLIIFGDVIEHLSVEDAQKVLEYASTRCKDMVVALPYSYPQEANDNEHERHVQDDLTKENIAERYPMLRLLKGDDVYGYYVKKQ